MTGLRDIQEPPCPHDEDQWKGCLTFVGDTLTYYINRRAQAEMLWSFWLHYAKAPYGEDPSLTNDFYESLTNIHDWIPYSETIVTDTKHLAWRAKTYPLGYRRLNERLDFYVTKPEFAKAFRVIRQLGRKRKGKLITEGVIFGNVRVFLIDDAMFGDKPRTEGVCAHWHPVS